MNRRDMMKTVGALAVGGTLPVVAKGEVLPSTFPLRGGFRLERYAAYRKMMENPEFAAKVNSLINNVSEVVWKLIAKGNLIPTTQYLPHGYKRMVINPAVRDLTIFGDHFIEILIAGGEPVAVYTMPVDTMYRIETTKGKLVEFQQGRAKRDQITRRWSSRLSSSRSGVLTQTTVKQPLAFTRTRSATCGFKRVSKASHHTVARRSSLANGMKRLVIRKPSPKKW